MPSRSKPIAAPTMSAIESTAPTSWKWTFSIVRAVDLGLGLGQLLEDSRWPVPAGRGGERAAVDHRRDVVQVAMLVLGLVLDGDLRGAEALLLHFAARRAGSLGRPERIDAGLNRGQIGAGVDEGAERHVAADSARTIEIGNSHGLLAMRQVSFGLRITILRQRLLYRYHPAALTAGTRTAKVWPPKSAPIFAACHARDQTGPRFRRQALGPQDLGPDAGADEGAVRHDAAPHGRLAGRGVSRPTARPKCCSWKRSA